MDWIQLAQGVSQWQVFMNIVMTFQIPQKRAITSAEYCCILKNKSCAVNLFVADRVSSYKCT
jgi:hypothetical protein